MAPVPIPLQGTLRLMYRYRATPTESDSDFYEIISLNYGDREKQPVTAALSARLSEDTDGNRKVQGYYPFSSADDKYRSSATQRLYTAYAEYHPQGSGASVRAGRQVLEEFPEAVSMDGALVRVEAGYQLAFSAFGGVPVNLFESSPSGDAMYGASAEWSPDAEHRGRYRVEYLHVRDDNVFGLHDDDLIGFSFDESQGPFSVHARYTLLEGASRDLVARLSGSVPDAGFLFQVQGTYVFHRIEALSFALDPYASFMMDLEPYLDISLRASKSFGDQFSIDAVFTSRSLVNGGTETLYNHEFKRVEISPRIQRWPIEELSLRVSADYWNSSANDFWTVTGDVSVALHRDILLSVGSSYALYSVDAFTGEEHDRVRTTTILLRWTVSKGSTIDARFSVEENPADRFRILEVGFRHAF